MAKKHDADLTLFAKDLKNLQSLLSKMAAKKDLEKIIEMIRIRNGWTTPAELAFARQWTIALSEQAKLMDKSMTELYKACNKVKPQG